MDDRLSLLLLLLPVRIDAVSGEDVNDDDEDDCDCEGGAGEDDDSMQDVRCLVFDMGRDGEEGDEGHDEQLARGTVRQWLDGNSGRGPDPRQ